MYCLCFRYEVLDRVLPGRAAKVVFKKLAVDQICFSPVCLAVFFATLAFCRKSTEVITPYFTKQTNRSAVPNHTSKLQDSNSELVCSDVAMFVNELRHKGVLLYLSEWLVWPPAQMINFFFLPTRFRVLYDNSISLLYDVYASHVCFDVQVDDIKSLAETAKKLCSQNQSTIKDVQLPDSVVNSDPTIPEVLHDR